MFWVLANNKRVVITNSSVDAGQKCDNGYKIISAYTNGKEIKYV